MQNYLLNINHSIAKKASKFLSLTTILLCSFTVCASQNIVFKSTPHPPSLLEMYSSQGCSSCPPAQALINRFLDSPNLWNKVIPIVFHVDYFNYIGWEDPFSSAKYSIRQRKLQREGLVNSVYTPGFVLNGHEWKGWFNGRALTNDELEQSSAIKLSAVLTPERVEVEYMLPDLEEPTDGIIHLAVLGFDLKTDIKTGENANKILTDNFVVLGYRKQKIRAIRQLLKYPKLKMRANKYAVVIWTTKKNGFIPTQVIGGFLTENWTF